MIELLLKPLLLMFLGGIVARVSYDLLRLFLDKIIGVRKFIEEKNLKEAVFYLDISSIIAFLVSLYFLIFFFSTSLRELGMFLEYIDLVVNYYPYLIYLFIIFVISAIVSDLLKKWIEKSTPILKKEVAGAARYVSFLVIFYIGLEIIGIKIEIISFTIKAIIVSILLAGSLAAGIGFGLNLAERLKKEKE